MPQYENSKYVGYAPTVTTITALDANKHENISMPISVDQIGSVGVQFPPRTFIFNQTQREMVLRVMDKYQEWCEIAKREKVDTTQVIPNTDITTYTSVEPVEMWSLYPHFRSTDNGQSCYIEFTALQSLLNFTDKRYNSYTAYYTGIKHTEMNSYSYRISGDDVTTLTNVLKKPLEASKAAKEQKDKIDSLFK